MHVTRDELGGEWGGMTAAITRLPASSDLASLLRGLPGDRCPCPHWGYVIAGRFAVRYPDHEETIAAGEAYYPPPGHVPDYLEDTQVFEASLTAERPLEGPLHNKLALLLALAQWKYIRKTLSTSRDGRI